MRIDAITTNPQQLKNAIDKAFKDGILRTWRKVLNDKKETLYSHIPEQWNEKAMMKPYVYKDKISFKIKWWSNNGDPGEEVKGYITGRFTEILLVHFSDYFLHLETFHD